MPEKKWLKVGEVSELLSITKSSVYRLAERGKLPAAKIGGILRIDGMKLAEFMEKQTAAKRPTPTTW
jgi:excisionase family DNA binding protein